MKQTFNMAFARFPYGGSLRDEVCEWLIETAIKAHDDPRFDDTFSIRIADTPITMSRNAAVLEAKRQNADFLLMIDSDMAPDCMLGIEVDALPFWDSTMDYMIENYHKGPRVVGAPYCGPAPHENVFVFEWKGFETGSATDPVKLDQFTREQAAIRTGFERVGAIGTGLIVYDMRAFDLLPPEYFYYDYTDEYKAQKASTEDVANTRDLSHLGVPIICNWHAWAGHIKSKLVMKPAVITLDSIGRKYVEAMEAGRRTNLRRVVMQGRGERVIGDVKILQQGESQYETVHPSGDGHICGCALQAPSGRQPRPRPEPPQEPCPTGEECKQDSSP